MDLASNNYIIQGDSINVLQLFPEKSIDLIFADPPYHLQLRQSLWRPDRTKVNAVEDEWDQFSSDEEYEAFCQSWLAECRRVLKDTGTIWVIGTYHNIYRIGRNMQDLGFWILNDVVWIKTNPMPNFRGVRFTNAHETLIWASKDKQARYTFNHHAMKALNDDLQMRSDWLLPICSGPERIKVNGKKAHSTQKPEALLYRVILSSSNPGDIILDPFFGTGTTGAVAKKLGRQWIGIELDPAYIELAQKRIDDVDVDPNILQLQNGKDNQRRQPRIPFGNLLENGLLKPGQALYFQADREQPAHIKPDSHLMVNDFQGSIHQVAQHLCGGKPCNGWTAWYYETNAGELHPIHNLRDIIRKGVESV